MRNKFFKLILVAFLSSGLLGKANAAFIEGEIYKNDVGVEWRYVGSFDLADGIYWNDANNDGFEGDRVTPLNGLDAAASIFGPGDFAITSFASGTSEATFNGISPGDNVVNHLAWYDGNITNISQLDEGILADTDNNGTYDTNLTPGDPTAGDVSAFVFDRGQSYATANPQNARYTYNINYVFEAVEVPEPSMLGLFSLVLFGFSALRFKKT
jgi:hypothetical protein